MNKIMVSLLIMLCSVATQLTALIIEAPDLQQFERMVENSDQKTFVLFDVDGTLIVPKDFILRPCRKNKLLNKQYTKLIIENPEIVPPGKYPDDYLFSQVLATTEYEIVDSHILAIIHALQKRNVKTIAFTRMHTGRYGVIPSMEDWRVKQLKELGIDFSQAFPQFPEVRIKGVESSDKTALFKLGVLCANNQDKGPVLIGFLDYVKWKPSRVIFIDDRMDYLQSVEDSLKGTEIEFVGFHYTAVEDDPRVANEKLAEFQAMHLAKTGIWLSDEAALKLMSAYPITHKSNK